jgi:DNA polymerase
MIVGEAPGRVEDEEGRPFVGAAGQLLNKLLSIAGLSRDTVYITNLVKCRPPDNRDPLPDEVEACLPYLRAQLFMVKPRVVVTLGRHSTREVLAMGGYRARGIGEVRGRAYRVRVGELETTVLPTYHPAAALYNPGLRGALEEDFVKLRNILNGKGIMDYMA